MKLSVCIPTYNGEAFLDACLESLTCQTLGDFEVIVCDDGSSDSTWEILERHAKQDSRFKIYRNKYNLGLVKNWKRCIDLAEGDWIKFLFQDDTLEQECLSRFSEHLNPDIPLVFCHRNFSFTGEIDSEIINHYTGLPTIETLFPNQTFITPEDLTNTVLCRTRQNFLGEPTACLFHRSALEKFGSFNENLVQFCDFEYWIRVGIHTGITYIPETLASFRIHNSSTSSNNRKQFRSEYIDNLLILYSWCYSSEYAPLLEYSKQLGLNLKKNLAAQSSWLDHYARTIGKDQESIYEEWKEIKDSYPKLRYSWHLLPHQLKHILQRHFLWRFNKHDTR